MIENVTGKLSLSDKRKARLLNWVPWLSFLVVTLPIPITFLVLFVAAGTTETAAVFLFLSFVSMGLGLVVGLLVLIAFFLYRRNWHSQLRERLAADGITATEMSWFSSELTSEERKIWNDLKQKNPLLGDAYCETLAARLNATRIISRAKRETLKIERQLNRARSLKGVDTSELLDDLMSDRQRLDNLFKEATVRLSAAKARLQAIEAAANRTLSQAETDMALRRLATSQEQSPLALEMASLERAALLELERTPIKQAADEMDHANNNESNPRR
ncbi:MAG TPA: hypothetical protein VLL54_05580 [Pyrinomonadaceae bacterium]|nr:hypothetical protein [Pyrinomonadaceae bacterium]